MKEEYTYYNQDTDIMPGFYESILYNSDSEYCANDGCDVEYEIKDFQGFKEAVSKSIVEDAIAPFLTEDDEICDRVEYVGVDSPAYYNFTTDRLIIKLNIDMDKLKEKLSMGALRDGFDKYLKAHYTSWDGFMSFVANNADEYFEDDRHHDVMVDYYLLTKIYDETDVVKCQESYDWPDYTYDIAEIANKLLYEFMEPVEEESEVEE